VWGGVRVREVARAARDSARKKREDEAEKKREKRGERKGAGG